MQLIEVNGKNANENHARSKTVQLTRPTLRKSPSAKLSINSGPAEKNPRPRGLYGTIPIPNSLEKAFTEKNLHIN